ncbi:hypothetical protein TSTA_085990 [Talaromyces stipitatus ATCC 10500]|uniref:Uncharacterized protein n=1 Tax=Talaromyces stipitatus (strain ATCC 10500 / CBS 375.48 / QM 6759 / NRRL 1006) TaxID=441959 RepID=B8M1Z0_TALSN|nr:uncharacterized protein TSTA_085990 [Talaromyces stipitatus ATCC 10500]EED21368.1 hypothetical protein TSTA_085990 [Talaromyces stipitatus ATCC 10500]
MSFVMGNQDWTLLLETECNRLPSPGPSPNPFDPSLVRMLRSKSYLRRAIFQIATSLSSNKHRSGYEQKACYCWNVNINPTRFGTGY